MISDDLARWMNYIEREIEKLKIFDVPKASSGWVYLQAPLTSTSFDGDSFSTTAKTLIDLSTVFGAPAGIKSIIVKVLIRDSGSSGAECLIRLGPTNTAGAGLELRCSGIGNDFFSAGCLVVPCNANGDIYYQLVASGALTLDVAIQIHGYELP
jgi:hypothetical protein